MRSGKCSWVAALALGWLSGPALAQQAAQPPTPATPATPAQTATPPAAPAPRAVAATVNGVPIPEVAVQRALKRVPKNKQAEARAEILKFLIDNTLIDQYLVGQKIAVAPQEVEEKLKQIQEDLKKQKSSLEVMLKDLMLTEPELRTQIEGQLRQDKFMATQANEAAIKAFFDGNKAMFDGTMVRARHILLSPPAGDAKAAEGAKARIAAMKKQVEDAAAQAVAKLPAQTDNLEREKARRKALEDAFGELAKKESTCPSKANGGDLDWFPFTSMVGPFAKTAFSLKPYQMSDAVATQFGQHLILVTDRKEGKEPKFEEVKEDVREVYWSQLCETLCDKLRPTAKVVVNPPAKP